MLAHPTIIHTRSCRTRRRPSILKTLLWGIFKGLLCAFTLGGLFLAIYITLGGWPL